MRAIALAADEAPRSGVVAAAMGVTTTGVSDVRDSLIREGLIWSPEHGRIAFQFGKAVVSQRDAAKARPSRYRREHDG